MPRPFRSCCWQRRSPSSQLSTGCLVSAIRSERAHDDSRPRAAGDARRPNPHVPRLAHRRRDSVSFSSATYLTFPPPAFGLRWYSAYFASDDWLRSTWLTLWLAASVVVLATLLGTLAALGIARLPKALRVLASALILSPLIVPVIVVAIGIYYAFARYCLVRTPAGLILAHTCLAVP